MRASPNSTEGHRSLRLSPGPAFPKAEEPHSLLPSCIVTRPGRGRPCGMSVAHCGCHPGPFTLCHQLPAPSLPVLLPNDLLVTRVRGEYFAWINLCSHHNSTLCLHKRQARGPRTDSPSTAVDLMVILMLTPAAPHPSVPTGAGSPLMNAPLVGFLSCLSHFPLPLPVLPGIISL